MNYSEVDRDYMQMAVKISQQSPDPYMKVGCVGVTKRCDGMSAFGYNDIPGSGTESWKDRDARRPLVVHAETMMCSMTGIGIIDTVYITLFPCVHCITQLAQNQIKRIVYKDIYDKDLSALEVAEYYDIKCDKYVEEGGYDEQ